MHTYIQKWGNSLGVRIPAFFSSQLKLKAGSLIDIKIEGDHLIILPQKHSLQNMLDNITKENIHNPIFTDTSLGIEEW